MTAVGIVQSRENQAQSPQLDHHGLSREYANGLIESES